MGHAKFKQSHGSECHHSHHCVSALQIISHFRFNVSVTFLSQHHAWKHITWVKIQEEAFIPRSPHVSSDSQNNTFKMNGVCVDVFRSLFYLYAGHSLSFQIKCSHTKSSARSHLLFISHINPQFSPAGLKGGELVQAAVNAWHGRCLMPPGALGGSLLIFVKVN